MFRKWVCWGGGGINLPKAHVYEYGIEFSHTRHFSGAPILLFKIRATVSWCSILGALNVTLYTCKIRCEKCRCRRIENLKLRSEIGNLY